MQSVETFSQAIGGTDAEGPPPARIVLMSDGKQTVPGGLQPEDEPRGVVHRGAGGGRGEDAGLDDLLRHRLRLDRDGRGQAPVPVAVDDASMRRIAELSGGQFFTAATEEELRQVYAELGEQIGYEVRRVDTSRPWLAGGALLLVGGVGAGSGWAAGCPDPPRVK